MSGRRPASTGGPRAVLIDSSAFYALADERDRRHREIADHLEKLARTGAQLFTTNLILAETHALILARSRRVDKAVEFLTGIHASERTTIVRVTEEDEQQALSILSRYQDKLFSFTDAASFAVMERLGITHALTLDDDFRQYGLMTLPHG
jgi:uncharacterized protein